MAHNEGLAWISSRTGEYRYSAGGQDKWLHPLSIYTAGEPILRGQPVSIPVAADMTDAALLAYGVITNNPNNNDNSIVLTRSDRHAYSIGFAMESAIAGGSVHILDSGRICYLYANNATEYWSSIFTDAARGNMLYAGPAAGTLTFDPVVAVTGGRKLIQLGSISNTVVIASVLTQVDVEVDIAGDGRGPIDNTQFEFVLGEAMAYTAGPFPPLCAVADGTISGQVAGTAILADNRYANKAHVLGFMLNPPQVGGYAAGATCIFMRKGLLAFSSPVLTPGATYYMGIDGQITVSAGSIVYPAAIVELGVARDARTLIVDINPPLLNVVDYPVGTLKPLLTGYTPDAGFLLCDDTTVYNVIDYPEFYAKYQVDISVITPVDASRFKVASKINPTDNSFYEICAYRPSYQPLTTIVNMLRGSGVATTSVTLDLTPFTTSGVQSVGGLTIDQFIPELYALVGATYKKVPGATWSLSGNILTGDVTGTAASGQTYILNVYRPEALARYQETTRILSTVDTASGYAINSTALKNYLANDAAAQTLTLGNDVAGSIVKILGQLQLGDNSTLDGLTITGPVVVKTDAAVQSLAIDNATGNVTVSTAQNYPTAAGHLVNKAYCDMHGAILSNVNTTVHGIRQGTSYGFSADMVDERHVGGWGWKTDSLPSMDGSGTASARSASVLEVTNAGVTNLGKQINFYAASAASQPAAAAGSIVLEGGAAATAYLHGVLIGNTSYQALQLGSSGVSNVINLLAVSNVLHITSDSIPRVDGSQAYTSIKAAAFQTVSTIKAKNHVVPFMRSGLKIINDTELYQYKLKGNDDRTRVGFIAEWTDELLAGRNHDENDLGTTLGVALKAIQELAADNEMLKKEIADLKATLSSRE